MPTGLLAAAHQGGPSAPEAAPTTAVRMEFSAQRMVVWLGALAVLWFILSALADSGNADIARALGGLLVFGALLALGPGAITNAKALVSGGT